ncbi:MAG: hypothetical protein IJD21_01895 [Oscillospiraceae bacterium]|nr:hypothetical protein [Oscillospiraceae bacterium]
MKSGNKVVQGIMVLLFLGVLAYFAVYTAGTFAGSTNTAIVYTYSSQRVLPAEGYLVREESVVRGGGDLVEIVVAEGENVAVGEVVARIYDSSEALEQHRELEELEEELERLNFIRSRDTEETEAFKLSGDITELIADIHADASQSKYTALEDGVDQIKDLIFRQGYTYTTRAAITEQIQQVNSRIVELQTAAAAATKAIRAEVAGIYSASVDGYETIFDIDELVDLTPDELRARALTWGEPEGSWVGKIVTDFDWYYVAIMDQEISKRVTTGDTVTVNFEGSAGQQDMEVIHLSVPDLNGQVVVVFHSDKNLSAITLLREQNVDVGYDNCEGLRIPTRALRADQQTGQLGVYRVTGAQAQWLPVELIFSGEDYYLVQSVVSDEPTVKEEANRLRAGDQILVGGKEVHDGKVVA